MAQPLQPTNEAGVLITFEGGEGAGKTTHIRFLAEALQGRGREVLCLREPGGTAIGEQVRAVLLSTDNDEMAPEAELLLYEAARAQLVGQVIAPALARGCVVLCDRFTDSTLAYQGAGRGLDESFIERASAFACQGLAPDRTVLLSTGGTATDGLMRATHRGAADRLEEAGLEFHMRVNDAFQRMAAAHPQRIRCVVSDKRKSVTARAVFRAVADLFPWMNEPDAFPEGFFERLDVSRGASLPKLGVRAADFDQAGGR